MSMLNSEELKKQIGDGTFKGLELLENVPKDISSLFSRQFKSIEELTSHLGYEKKQPTNN